MSGKVIFSLTSCQAAALLALKLGDAIRGDSQGQRDRIREGLRLKGLISPAGVLTDLGATAVPLCARLAIDPKGGGA